MISPEITILVNGFVFTDNSFSFFDQSVMPKVTDFYPISANPVIKNLLTINGENFNIINGDVTIELVS